MVVRHVEQEIDDNNSTITNSTTNIVLMAETDWSIDVVVNPTSNLPVLITIVVLILICMCVAIVHLHLKEVKEDSVENQDVFMAWFDSR